MKFLVDMNLSPSWAEFLTKAGFTAIHWSFVGAPHASDRELMLWAAEHNYVVLTADLDFSTILATTRRRSPSVMVIRSDLLTPSAFGETVLAAIEKAKVDLVAGAIVSVDPARVRLRVLPLRTT